MSLFSSFPSVQPGNILVLAVIAGSRLCEAADYCYFDSGVKYCGYGCCSDACCSMSVAAIIGLVIGGVIALAGFIGCVICLACMCKKSRANRDANTVHPIHNTNSVYVHNTGNQPSARHPPPSYNQYGQYSSYPGSTGFHDDAAYPPGAHPPPAYSYSDPRSDKY